jgi:hypothetical protein
MLYQDILAKVLHKAQATRKGAVLMHVSNTNPAIDPWLLISTLSTSASPAPSLYNKSKKRQLKTNASDDKEGEGSRNKKVDIGYAISSLSAKMAKERKLQEDYKSN